MRLIDADALSVKFDGHIVAVWKNDLDAAPTIDAAPVVHGHWVEKDDGWDCVYYDCSVCGNSWSTIDGTPSDNGMSYCPNCGAKMDGGGENVSNDAK